ncbi:acetyl-CoA carboxylase biotin carboxyl carrier protein [Brackiella oedipodis]|uniref:acetyl-CoA carboxylase biotin carboxyl carrier protein n=1 Tax=Brackiella oedipodis TaxID=124225 RepID=UPI00048D4349|nr:acetyl-CoA carboxylase biotin carboxyl carrier protein [Brackiella oedipodis]
MDLRKLKTLIDLVSDSEIAELEITEGEGKVKIVKTTPPSPQGTTQSFYAPAPAPMPTYAPAPAPETPAPASNAAAPAPASEPEPQGQVIKAPMVGTFYRAPNPNSPAYVEVGSSVSEGETLCIIEAMKLLNEIESDCSGIIKKILVENGEPVEYGQPLFIVG